jgi:hypothetical protein
MGKNCRYNWICGVEASMKTAGRQETQALDPSFLPALFLQDLKRSPSKLMKPTTAATIGWGEQRNTAAHNRGRLPGPYRLICGNPLRASFRTGGCLLGRCRNFINHKNLL